METPKWSSPEANQPKIPAWDKDIPLGTRATLEAVDAQKTVKPAMLRHALGYFYPDAKLNVSTGIYSFHDQDGRAHMLNEDEVIAFFKKTLHAERERQMAALSALEADIDSPEPSEEDFHYAESISPKCHAYLHALTESKFQGKNMDKVVHLLKEVFGEARYDEEERSFVFPTKDGRESWLKKEDTWSFIEDLRKFYPEDSNIPTLHNKVDESVIETELHKGTSPIESREMKGLRPLKFERILPELLKQIEENIESIKKGHDLGLVTAALQQMFKADQVMEDPSEKHRTNFKVSFITSRSKEKRTVRISLRKFIYDFMNRTETAPSGTAKTKEEGVATNEKAPIVEDGSVPDNGRVNADQIEADAAVSGYSRSYADLSPYEAAQIMEQTKVKIAARKAAKAAKKAAEQEANKNTLISSYTVRSQMIDGPNGGYGETVDLGVPEYINLEGEKVPQENDLQPDTVATEAVDLNTSASEVERMQALKASIEAKQVPQEDSSVSPEPITPGEERKEGDNLKVESIPMAGKLFERNFDVPQVWLEKMDEWNKLTPEQQLHAYNIFKELKENASRPTAQGMWEGLVRKFKKSKEMEMQMSDKDALIGIIKGLAASAPKMHVEKGEVISALVTLNFDGKRKYRESLRKVESLLNAAGDALAHTPREWRQYGIGTEGEESRMMKMVNALLSRVPSDRKNFTTYMEREQAYESAREQLAESMREAGYEEGEIVRKLFEVHKNMIERQFALNADDAVLGMEDANPGFMKKAGRWMVDHAPLGYMVAGAVTKFATARVLGIVGSVAFAAVRKTGQEWNATAAQLRERDRAAKMGIVDTTSEALNIAQAEQVADVQGERRDVGLIGKLEMGVRAVQDIDAQLKLAKEQGNTEEARRLEGEKARAVERLNNRAVYAYDKLRLDRINFGPDKGRAMKIARFMETLGTAKMLVADNGHTKGRERKIGKSVLPSTEERIMSFFANKEDTMHKKRRALQRKNLDVGKISGAALTAGALAWAGGEVVERYGADIAEKFGSVKDSVMGWWEDQFGSEGFSGTYTVQARDTLSEIVHEQMSGVDLNDLKQLSSEQLKEIGISSGNIDLIKVGESIDLAALQDLLNGDGVVETSGGVESLDMENAVPAESDAGVTDARSEYDATQQGGGYPVYDSTENISGSSYGSEGALTERYRNEETNAFLKHIKNTDFVYDDQTRSFVSRDKMNDLMNLYALAMKEKMTYFSSGMPEGFEGRITVVDQKKAAEYLLSYMEEHPQGGKKMEDLREAAQKLVSRA